MTSNAGIYEKPAPFSRCLLILTIENEMVVIVIEILFSAVSVINYSYE